MKKDRQKFHQVAPVTLLMKNNKVLNYIGDGGNINYIQMMEISQTKLNNKQLLD